MDRARGLRRGREPRARILPAHSRLLAGAAGQFACARLLRDKAEAYRSRGAGGGLHDRRAAAAWPCAHRPSLRDRIARTYVLAIDRPGCRARSLELTPHTGTA